MINAGSSMRTLIKLMEDASGYTPPMADGAMPEEPTTESAISLDIPLLIRLLEYAREEASTDVDLHTLAEKMSSMSVDGQMLGMDDYDQLVSGVTGQPKEVTPQPQPQLEGYDDYEDHSFSNGDTVRLKPSWEDRPGETFTVSNLDGGKCWIGDKNGRGWKVSCHQIEAVGEDDGEFDDFEFPNDMDRQKM